MLVNQPYTKSPSLVWQIAIHRSLVFVIIFHFIHSVSAAATHQLQNITVPVTSPQITYTPFVCNTSTGLADPQPCTGAWHLSNSKETISTTGPTSTSGSIIPQLFFEFQASVLYLTPVTSLSNASVNLTLSAGGESISTVFNSSLGVISIVNLPPNETTHLTVTYIPTTGPTVFCLQSLIISVLENTSTRSFFPTPTLPPFTSLPTVHTLSIPSVVATPTPTPTLKPAPAAGLKNASNKTKQAVGITIGLGLGLTALAVAGFYYWKKRKQRPDIGPRIEEAKSEWSKESRYRFSPLSRLSVRMPQFRTP